MKSKLVGILTFAVFVLVVIAVATRISAVRNVVFGGATGA